MTDSTRDDTSESFETAASAGLFRALFEEAEDGLFVAGADRRWVAVNPRGAELTGFAVQELVGMTLTDLVSPDTTASSPASGERLPHAGSPMTEGTLRRKDGRVLTVEIRTRKLPDGQRLEIIRDISDRHRAVEALRESEWKFRSLVESALDPIFTCDAGVRYLYANAAAAATFGKTPDEIIGKSADDLFPADIVAVYRAGVAQVMQTGEGLMAEDHVESNGRTFYLSTLVQPVRDRHGKTVGAQVVIRDITNLKRAELALRESEERLRQAVSVANIGIFDHDHLTDALFWSPQQRDIYGMGPDESVQKKDIGPFDDNETPRLGFDPIDPADRARITAAVRRAHDPAGDGVYNIEHRIVRRDGSIRWVAVRSQTVFDGEGDTRHPVRTIGAVRDITETKQAEAEQERLRDELFQAQKMESVGRLAGGVAHDFNNMLNVIGGYAELALGQLDASSTIAADIREIQTAAQRSADLTRQLLAFARRQIVAPRVLRFNDVIARSLAMLRRLIGENVEVVFQPGDDLWAVSIDPSQLDQMLATVCVNARDAITGVGRVTIQTKNVVIDEVYCALQPGSVPGEYVRLEVADNGRGMDPSTLRHIFEPFYSTKEKGLGAGLGLATVHGIASQNHGFANVRSEEGQGTTVAMFLPRVADETGTAADPQPKAPARGTETILLVEDEAILLRYGKTLLERLGYTVLAANGPGQALRVAEAHAGRIQLLVTDVVMPEMNGPELAERLVARDARLKCLFVSGYYTRDIAPPSVDGRTVRFLPKPFNRDTMAAMVRETLDEP